MTEKEKLRGAIASAVCNAGNYPDGVAHTVLGRNMAGVVDAVLEAVEATGLLKDLETAREIAKTAPFEVGDIVRELGYDEPTGEIVNITEYPDGKGYRVKLYKEYANIKSIIYFDGEIELIERPGK